MNLAAEPNAISRRPMVNHVPGSVDLPERTDEDVLAQLYIAHGIGAQSRQRAARLVKKTGGIAAALRSPATRLRYFGASVAEIQVLELVGSAISTVLRRPLEERPLLTKLSSVIDYLHSEMAGLSTEMFRVLYLNSRLRLVHDEVMGHGSVCSVEVHPRTIIVRALEVSACHLLLVHNHPSGEANPTREDVQLTVSVREAGKLLDICVLDHVIIAQSGHFSLRSAGLI